MTFARVSDDGCFLVITVHHGAAGTQTEIYFKRLDSDGSVIPLVNNVDATFFVTHIGDAFIILTNWNAPNWRILRADVNNPSLSEWAQNSFQRSPHASNRLLP